jgi:hypothetical protein
MEVGLMRSWFFDRWPKPSAQDRAPLVAGLIAGALVPAVVAVVLFVSLAVHRPLLARAVRGDGGAAAARLTLAWALALAAIAAVQAAGAMLGMGSITSPLGLAARTGFALAVEAAMLVASTFYLTVSSRKQDQGGARAVHDHA